MKKIIMLTQKNCAKCVVLEEYLENGLQGQYENDMVRITREQHQNEFMKLARRNGIVATPALLIEDKVLVNPNPDNVLDFLKENGF